ncbi:MAG: glutamate 5-kinase [Acidimicrobiia bacterium]|nr:glutamate 5-kinase [Acidimicrobiia bacterium]
MSRIVVKIGTSSLTDEAGVIDVAVIEKVTSEVATLRHAGHEVTIVTSGAIAAGLPVLGISAADRPSDAVSLQAMSSIGQPELLRTWAEALSDQGLIVGQILLAPHNFGDRAQYLHARSTLTKLHELGVVPLINENDAVTDAEIRYGDNDRIAALVAHLISADVLILLTDTDGVLTADPRVDPSASLIEEVAEFDQLVDSVVGGAGTVRGSGGMASKLTAARIAAWSGVRTVIANASRPGVISDAASGTDAVGTTVNARPTTLSARKLWIGFAMPAVASITVDAGARRALEQGGRSLLAVGVSSIDGSFEKRDPVDVADPDGVVFAKGITRTSSEELAGLASAADGAGDTAGVVIHVDDLVVLA